MEESSSPAPAPFSRADPEAMHPLLAALRTHPVAEGHVAYFDPPDSEDRLCYREWPAPAPRALLVGIHGMAAHSEYFVLVADQLVEAGITTYALDLKHHGYSTGRKGDIESFEELIEQVHAFLLFLRETHPDLPVFLAGISMGGCLAANHAILHPDTCAGTILFSPAVKVNASISLRDVVKFPYYGIVALLRRGKPVVDIQKRQGPGVGTRVPGAQAYRDEDSLRVKKVSLRYLLQVKKWIDHAYQHAGTLQGPVVTFQGTNDNLVDPSGVQEFHERLRTPDKRLVRLPGGYHSLFSDPAMVEEDGWETFRAWILERASASREPRES